MKRFASALLVLLAVVVLTAGAMLYLSYGMESYPGEAAIAGLGAPASLALYPDEGLPAVIRASSDQDYYAALGYAQAQEMTFTLLLWRQAARGRLGVWLGADALPLDRHAARLGFAREARRLYQALPESERAVLDAFASGVNAGLRDGHNRDRFTTLLDVEAAPYTPEDVLAIERLFAWCATAIAAPDSVTLPDETRRFLRQDSLFRHTLGLFGWHHSASWTHQDSSRTMLTSRWVTGASALPAIHESVRIVQRDSSLMLTIPGTPFPLLRAGTSAHAVLPRSRAAIRPAGARSWSTDYVLLEKRDGGTFVEPVQRSADALLLSADTSAHLAWELTWIGLTPVTDASAWLAGDRSGATARLLPVSVVSSGSGSAPGESGAVYTRGIVSAPEAQRPWLVQRLDTLARLGVDPRDAFRDTGSAWAARVHASLVARLDSSLLEAAHHRVAYEYLANWTGNFEGPSIGATVFHTFTQRLGIGPDDPAALPDSAEYFAAVRYTSAFTETADTLVQLYGAEPLDWRWEQVRAERRSFPLWATADSLGLQVAHPRSFAPFLLPGEGHPTTLRWLDLTGGADATYVAVVETGERPSWALYRLRYQPARPFSRYQTAGRRLQLQQVAYPENTGYHLTLLPVR